MALTTTEFVQMEHAVRSGAGAEPVPSIAKVVMSRHQLLKALVGMPLVETEFVRMGHAARSGAGAEPVRSIALAKVAAELL